MQASLAPTHFFLISLLSSFGQTSTFVATMQMVRTLFTPLKGRVSSLDNPPYNKLVVGSNGLCEIKSGWDGYKLQAIKQKRITRWKVWWKILGKPSFKKNRNFTKNFHKMVTPPPYCICEILIQIFFRLIFLCISVLFKGYLKGIKGY